MVHAVWIDHRNGNEDLYYRSFDGEVWGLERILSTDGGPGNQSSPEIAAEDGKVHVVWQDKSDVNWDVLYRSFNGTDWSEELELSVDYTNDSQLRPIIVLDDSDIHVVWNKVGLSGQNIQSVHFDGSSWTIPVNVTDWFSEPNFRSYDIDADKGTLHLVWALEVDNITTIHYRKFNNGEWSDEEDLVSSMNILRHPAIAVDGWYVYITWDSYSPGLYDYRGLKFVYYDGHEWTGWDTISVGYPWNRALLSKVVVEGGQLNVIWRASVSKYVTEYRFYHRVARVDHGLPSSTMDPPEKFWITEGDMAINWIANDDYGLDRVVLMYRYGHGPRVFQEWTEGGTYDITDRSINWGTSYLPPLHGDGYYELYVMAVDLADNYEQVGILPIINVTFAYDSTAPTGGIEFIDEDVWITTQIVYVQIHAHDYMSSSTGDTFSGLPPVKFRFSNDDYWDDEDWSDIPELPAVYWDLGPGDGSKTVYCQFKDLAGLLSEIYSASIRMDGRPPEGSIVINGGALYTTAEEIGVNLTAFDETSGVASIRISNDGIWDGEVWIEPTAYMDWKGNAMDDNITVYYQLLDFAGLTSKVYTDSITLDKDPPTGSITINAGNEWTNSPTVTATITFTDAISGVAAIWIWDANAQDQGSKRSPRAEVSWTFSDDDGRRTIMLRLEDEAGRISLIYDDTIILDTTSPELVSVNPSNGLTDVSIDQNILLEFSEEMNRSSVERIVEVVVGDTLVTGTFEWSKDGTRVEFIPDVAFEPGTLYAILLEGNVWDLAGNNQPLGDMIPFTTLETKDGEGGEGEGGLLPSASGALAFVALIVSTSVMIARKHPRPRRPS